jgi:hypothetical protein
MIKNHVVAAGKVDGTFPFVTRGWSSSASARHQAVQRPIEEFSAIGDDEIGSDRPVAQRSGDIIFKIAAWLIHWLRTGGGRGLRKAGFSRPRHSEEKRRKDDGVLKVHAIGNQAVGVQRIRI